MTEKTRRRISEKELLDALKHLSVKLKRTPLANDVNKYGKYGATTYCARFGSQVNARKKAGLGGKINRQWYTDRELLSHLKFLSVKLKKIPSGQDINRDGKYNEHLYYARFGSIVNARRKAGLKKGSIKPLYTEKQLLKELRRLHTKLKKNPSIQDINSYGKYSFSPYYTRFGNVVNARKRAGLK